MKARVKATGEIIDVADYSMIQAENFDKSYSIDEVEMLNDEQESRIIPIEPPISYWDQLKHQYAGMAMQGILSSDKILGIFGMQKGKELDDMIGNMSVKIATTLVNRLKEKQI